ncbi:MAG: N-acetylmuramidase family protein [Nitrosarchaeum sp.]
MKTLIETDYVDAAKLLGCEIEVIKAISQIEAPKGGFNDDGTPVTLFEGHWFHRFTSGKFDVEYPYISYPKWTRKWYGKDQIGEKERLDKACELDRTSALMSASWGKFQIMGFNFGICGFKTIQKFVNAMYKSESQHLMAFCNYIKNSGLIGSLTNLDWETFAYLYNGPEYKKNRYAERLYKTYMRLLEKK